MKLGRSLIKPVNDMNVLIVTPGYPYKENMYYVFVKKLVDEWAKTGHHCTVISPQSIIGSRHKKNKLRPFYFKDEVVDGITVDVYSPKCISAGSLTIAGVSISQYFYSRAVTQTAIKLNRKFDFIYAHFIKTGQYTFPYAQMSSRPLVVATGESVIEKYGRTNFTYRDEDFRNYVRCVVSVSSKNKTEAANLGLIEESNCRVFPNGTDLSRFTKLDRNTCRKKLGLSTSDFIIISVGALIERKGQNRILEAVKGLNNDRIKMLFIGKGDLVLESDNIIYKGPVANEILPTYLNAADIFCLPTLHEGCCNAVIEAMACGLPIISSDKNFNHDVLNSHNSILVDPLDIKSIRTAIDRLFHDEQLRIRLSDSVSKDAKELAIETRANSIYDYIKTQCDI